MPKILLVEDNEMVQNIVLRRLERNGFELVTASDGATGVIVAQRELPDLILMDMSLPVMDGLTTTRQIKTTPATSHIPIIALTAYGLAEDRDIALSAGCDEYDTKPIDFPRLLKKIDVLLNQGHSLIN